MNGDMLWKTRTRNKLFAIWLTLTQIFNIAIIYGWLILERPNAPEMFLAVNGPTGIWGALNAVSIAWENAKKSKQGEGN